jgi:D-amino-acid dehydrogenase
LAAAVERLGGVLRFGDTITNLSSNGKRVAVTLGEGIGQTIETFDRVVICAGVASRAFAQQLGDPSISTL